MANRNDLQGLIDLVHAAFKEKGQSDEVLQWDRLVSAIVTKTFDEENAEAFTEALAGLMAVFANDLIGFTLEMMMKGEDDDA